MELEEEKLCDNRIRYIMGETSNEGQFVEIASSITTRSSESIIEEVKRFRSCGHKVRFFEGDRDGFPHCYHSLKEVEPWDERLRDNSVANK